MKRVFIPALATIAIFVAAAQSAWAQPSVDVLGELQNRAGKTIGAFEGTLDITGFRLNDAGDLVADGQLSGDVINRGGNVIRSIEDVPVTLPVTDITAAEHDEASLVAVCQVLNLSLGLSI